MVNVKPSKWIYYLCDIAQFVPYLSIGLVRGHNRPAADTETYNYIVQPIGDKNALEYAKHCAIVIILA